MQQIVQQVDFRLALLAAVHRELLDLQRVRDEDRRRQLTDAALEALEYAKLRTPA